MRGFTTVRDLGGPSFALKRAIDEGLVVGPRIYPSGAMITITGGHGDFRSAHELPRRLGAPLTIVEELNASQLADSPDEVRMRTREQLLLGASQIKLTAGGGVASPHSPLDVSTFTEEELRAAVQAAANWGTYVGVHAYTPEAIQRSIAAGVKVIEHGHLMDEASARLIAEKGLWLSFQPFVDDGFTPPMPPSSMARLRQIWSGTERTVELAKKYRIKMAWGTDILFSAANATRQGAMLVTMAKWFSPARGAGDGHRHQRRTAAAVRPAQPVSRQAGRGEGGRACRPAAGRRESAGGPQSHCRPGQELPGHHEGREGLQEFNAMSHSQVAAEAAACAAARPGVRLARCLVAGRTEMDFSPGYCY